MGARASAAAAQLRQKLIWLTLFRLAMVTVLLGGTALVTWTVGSGSWRVAAPVYVAILVTYVASVVFALLFRAHRFERALAYGQIVLDVTVAAGVVASTGYSESVFVFLFSLAVVNGSILLFRRGALAAAALATASYLGLVLLRAPPRTGLGSALFAHVAAFVATAALASYLAELLRSTGERLAAREEDLADMTALHGAIVQSLTSGLLTLDPAGRITFLNRAGEAMTGWPLAAIRGEPAADRFGAFSAAVPRGEAEFRSARGDRLLLGYSSFPLVSREGAPSGQAIIFQDLTQLRAMELAVQRSERAADLGRLAAGLAHELRNPLASMAGSVELLRGVGGLAPDELRLLDIVFREASRLEKLVSEFLAYARPAAPRRVRADLAELADETLRVFANDPAAAAFRLDRALEPAQVECDPDQLRQVVWNLLANAADAVQKGAAGTRTIRVGCGRRGPEAWLAVEDDGPGIDSDDLARVFLPFFTTKQTGTGLGLAMVQRIVDAHGGRITVSSARGAGARFEVHLPVPVAGANAAG